MTATTLAPPAAHRRPGFIPTLLATRRGQLLTLLAAVVVVGVVVWAIWWLALAGREVSTDNAYVGAEVAQVTPLVSGPVAKVLVSETQWVKAGQPLVLLDDADARIAVEQASAELGQAERRVRGYFANEDALAAQVAARGADIARADAEVVSAQADLERARTDLTRRQALASSGAVSGDELTNAQNRFSSAQAALAAARAARTQAAASRTAAGGSREAANVLVAGASVEDNPEVAAARARLDAAQLALTRTVIRAPTDGIVARKQVEVGQQAQLGSPLMSITPIEQAYVDANFKEVQLQKVAIGQPVVLTSDLYGPSVKFHGRVKGLAGGTGAAFSLIPAQNASGNWIKVVQRLPVRISLDPAELARHPLRVGLSMTATIDVSSDVSSQR
jgi:membrane fusion protein (multidrug efflux system)